MKIGIAKDNYGIFPGDQYAPVNPKDGKCIIKDHEYIVPEGYDFDSKDALFRPKKKEK